MILVENLFKDGGILDLVILCQQNHLGDDLCRFGVVIDERQEYPAAVLGMNGNNANGTAGLLVDHTTSKVDIVVRQPAIDDHMASGYLDVAQL